VLQRHLGPLRPTPPRPPCPVVLRLGAGQGHHWGPHHGRQSARRARAGRTVARRGGLPPLPPSRHRVQAAADVTGAAAIGPRRRRVGPQPEACPWDMGKGCGRAPTSLGQGGHWHRWPRDGLLGPRSWPGDLPPPPWRGVVPELACCQ
jgi:hypothetical protein